jgi:hypothetical protein
VGYQERKQDTMSLKKVFPLARFIKLMFNLIKLFLRQFCLEGRKKPGETQRKPFVARIAISSHIWPQDREFDNRTTGSSGHGFEKSNSAIHPDFPRWRRSWRQSREHRIPGRTSYIAVVRLFYLLFYTKKINERIHRNHWVVSKLWEIRIRLN